MTDQKVDIVIQGRYDSYTDEIIESYLQLPFLGNLIVSCWEDDKPNLDFSGVQFVRNKYPFSFGTDNKNLQIVSSLNGLKLCNSKFSIKTRSDQKFTHESMLSMYDYYINNSKTEYNYRKPDFYIMISGIYNNLLFHPRDHIFWGYTENLIELFDIPLEYNSVTDRVKVKKEDLWKYYKFYTRTETYLGSNYASNFYEDMKFYLLEPEKYFYDGAPHWHDMFKLSLEIVPQIFKSFPKRCIDFNWVKLQQSDFNFNIVEEKMMNDSEKGYFNAADYSED